MVRGHFLGRFEGVSKLLVVSVYVWLFRGLSVLRANHVRGENHVRGANSIEGERF